MKKLVFHINIRKQPYWLVFISILFNSCTYEKGTPDYNSYPTEIGSILINNCATPGCHNASSSEACAGLNLSSWEDLFKGSRNNSSVIPFRPDHSFLLFSINTFEDLGPQLCPTMPIDKPPLSRSEIITIKDWIASGAPDINGNIKWGANPNRRKIYVSNQGCDYISVFDADSKLIMRSIDVGATILTESPHDMLVSPDGQYLYVTFYLNSIIQKFRTADGVKIGELDLGTISWHAMAISGDGRYAICSHWDPNGSLALIDLSTLTLVYNYQGTGLLVNPHGCSFNSDGTVAYVTSLGGNYIYKIDLTDPSNPDFQEIPLQPGQMPVAYGAHKPYEVEFSPDYSKYYVTCQGTNEIRAFQTSNDSLLKIIATSGVPQLISFSKTRPYAFVSCLQDSTSSVTISSVDIINTTSDQLVSTVNSGYQPRGIAVDDANDCVWIANRNVSGLGVAPHHSTSCAGRNGYVTVINMQTLQLLEHWKTEVGVDPYCVAVKP